MNHWMGNGALRVVVCLLCFGARGTAQEPINVAPNGTANQSSTVLGGLFGGEASTAIDRITDGDNNLQQVTHTDFDDPAPSWEVDLGQEYEIATIVLWNRTDCCSERLTDFVVSVLDAQLNETFSEVFFPDGTGFPDPAMGGFEIEVNVPGSIVEVRLLDKHPEFDPGEYFLSLAEVQVLAVVEGAPIITRQPLGGRVAVGGSFTFSVEATGTEPLSYQWEKNEVAIDGATDSSLVLNGLSLDDAADYSVVISNPVSTVFSDFATLDVTPPNLALCGVASQSTTFGGDASLAIDGNTNGNGPAVTHTSIGDPRPWWELRLAADARINTIVLWNRTDCCQERLSNFTVSVLNAGREEVWSEEFFTDGTFAPTMFEILEVDVEGRVVHVEKSDQDLTNGGVFLSLAEVEVLGDETCMEEPEPQCPLKGEAGFADTHCDRVTVTGPEDGTGGDYLVTAEGTDASGEVVQYAFTAVHQGRGTTITRGPYAVNWAFLPLTFGTWDISVTVDDYAHCPDEAADATCTQVVEVIDPACVPGDLCNVAIRGEASQSSTFFFGAHVAIDGITDGDNNQGQVTHTGFNDPVPTWEVELDQNYTIESIVLWNRTDCCAERLTNFTVTIFDENRQIVRRDEFFTDGAGFPDTTMEGFEILIDGDVGRIVEVQLDDSHPTFNAGQFFLSLAEVQIFSRVSGAGEICDNGVDDDGDGEIDCQDPDCVDASNCQGDRFVRGDTDTNGRMELTDAIGIFNFLFITGIVPSCIDAADADDNGSIELTDGVRILNVLFLGFGEIPAPGFMSCGEDPTEDNLESNFGVCDYGAGC